MPSTVKGMQLAKVLQLAKDPLGENRILINIPSLNKSKINEVWAKIARLDAGNNRGTFFLPEIGDDVIVGFIDDDNNKPVVLGMLNSRLKPAPIKASNNNQEKGYVSRSNMKVIFNDEKKSISIETPGGNKILLTEENTKIQLEDQKGNKITMDADGIKIESIKDIVLKAKADIKVEGVDIKVEGVNINVKGNGQTKIEGIGGVELISSATTTVKGSLIKLN